MARWGRRSKVVAALLVVLTATLVPSFTHGNASPSAAPLTLATGGPGCGNGTDPCIVTFTESGLPGSPNWNVTVATAGTNSSGGTNQVVFDLGNGSWNYQVQSYDGYTPSPSSGSFTVSGNDVGVPTISFTLPTYKVTFQQTGLPGGTQWTVDLNGNSQPTTGATDQFTETNGTYPFSITSSDSTYTPSPNSGSVKVAGSAKLIPVTFSQVTYTVTFTETGFPLNSGPTWKVTLNGIPLSTKSSSTISFSEPNGTYPYTIQSSSSEYEPIPPSGQVTVSGGPAGASVHFITLIYNIYFNESGFPLGGSASWSVNVAGSSPQSSSTSDSLVYPEPNGSYSFTIHSSTPQYQPSPASGTATVNGANAEVSITFVLSLFAVFFNQTGLGSGLEWSVALNGGPPSLSFGTSIVFEEADGSYSFVVKSVDSRYQPTPAFGSFTVNGLFVNKAITFSLVTYAVTFSESGYPLSLQRWSVTLSGTLDSSSTSTISVTEPNGSYPWSVTPISGWHAVVQGPGSVAQSYSGTATVNGAGVSYTVTWTRVVYDVWFNETGLPSGISWGVTANSTPMNSTTSSILFNLPNGTYPFSVGPLSGYHASVYHGSVTVSNGPTTQSISWGTVTYSFTFYETGLPTGRSWTVTMDGGNESSNLPVLTFTVPNGSYNFVVGREVGYVPYPPGGVVNVTGANNATSIQFLQFAYPVTFVESGLAAGVNWSIMIDGIRFASITTSITALEANGSYSYVVNRVVGYTPTSPAGGFRVSGSAEIVNITFLPATYNIQFSPFGLLTTQTWSVTINSNFTEIGAGDSSIVFSEPNGTYRFTIPWLPLSIPQGGTATEKCAQTTINITLPNGSVQVCGRNVNITISFNSVPGFAVTFSETGLGPGLFWGVSIAGEELFESGSTLVASIPDGTYTFFIGNVPGYTLPVSSGVVQVTGSPVQVNVTFIWAGQYQGPPTDLSLLEWTLVGASAVAAAMVALALIIRRRRNRAQNAT